MLLAACRERCSQQVSLCRFRGWRLDCLPPAQTPSTCVDGVDCGCGPGAADFRVSYSYPLLPLHIEFAPSSPCVLGSTGFFLKSAHTSMFYLVNGGASSQYPRCYLYLVCKLPAVSSNLCSPGNLSVLTTSLFSLSFCRPPVINGAVSTPFRTSLSTKNFTTDDDHDDGL